MSFYFNIENYCSVAFFPIHIGDYVVIDDDCVINAANIGSFVQ
jgi:hypothetical protein